MHAEYQKMLNEAREKWHEKIAAIERADRLLATMGQSGLLDLASDVHTPIADTDYIDNQWVPTDRVHFTINIHADDRAAARQIILDGDWPGHWEKSYLVEHSYKQEFRPYVLKERWMLTLNEKETTVSIPPRDRVTIYFLSPAHEGDKLSDTCTVEKIVREAGEATSYLTVTCKK